MNKEILIATTNKHKLKEIGHILKGVRVTGYEVRVKENGKTFEANAIKKARAGAKRFGKLTIADDSGLMVNALGGRPGVRSARFAIPPTPENLCQKLLRTIKRSKRQERGAKFVCAIAIARPGKKISVVRGVCRGRITREMRGSHGFGYDPVFIPCGYQKTFAEMSLAMKNRLSHRSRALKKASLILKRLYSKI